MSDSKSSGTSYIQLPAKIFIQRYPEFCMRPPLCFMVPMFLADDNYIVRMKEGRIEFGYGEDAWEIQ